MLACGPPPAHNEDVACTLKTGDARGAALRDGDGVLLGLPREGRPEAGTRQVKGKKDGTAEKGRTGVVQVRGSSQRERSYSMGWFACELGCVVAVG
jgi:hypothetical protein